MVLLDAALRRLAPAGEDDGAWPTVSGTDAVHFITDGAVVRSLDRRVLVHSVFEPAANVAVTAFDVRPPMAAAERGRPFVVAEAYIGMANFSAQSQKVRVSLSRGNTVVNTREIQIGAGEAYRESVPILGRGEGGLHLHLEAPDNALAIDDDGYAWLDRARPLSVLVVGAQTPWLRQLLAQSPDVRAAYVTPGAYRTAGQDVTIFDRWAPADPPREPAIYFAPPLNAWLTPAAWRDGAAGAPE